MEEKEKMDQKEREEMIDKLIEDKKQAEKMQKAAIPTMGILIVIMLFVILIICLAIKW